jgi:hypothetical protein
MTNHPLHPEMLVLNSRQTLPSGYRLHLRRHH